MRQVVFDYDNSTIHVDDLTHLGSKVIICATAKDTLPPQYTHAYILVGYGNDYFWKHLRSVKGTLNGSFSNVTRAVISAEENNYNVFVCDNVEEMLNKVLDAYKA